MKRITSGQFYRTLENMGKIEWSRLDMSEAEVKEEVLWCYEQEMDLDETVQHFHYLIDDYNDDYDDYDGDYYV